MSTSAINQSIGSKEPLAMAKNHGGQSGIVSGRPFINISDSLTKSSDAKKRVIDDFSVPPSSFQSAGSASQRGLCSVDPRSNQFEECKIGDLETVKQLVNSSNVNLKDSFGRKSTCLHFAAGFGRKEVCEYLITECNADPCIKDEG